MILRDNEMEQFYDYLCSLELKPISVKFCKYVVETSLLDTLSRTSTANTENYQFKKNIIDRLAGKLMCTKANTGKKALAMKIIEEAFNIVRTELKLNPLIVLFGAYCNAHYRQTVRYIKYGSGNLARAVELTTDNTICYFLSNWVSAANKSRKPISKALASELIECYKGTSQSKLVLIKNEQDKVSAKANIN